MYIDHAIPCKGVFAALWLPTDSDGNLLHNELIANIRFLKAHGIHGILALGSTGEFPQFDIGQRKAALAAVAELAAPLPVIANISDIRPRIVAELGQFARALGLPAVAIMPPGFFKSSQEDVLAHFVHASEHSGLPTLLYNFPDLVGTRINLETIATFADRCEMLGIKQSGSEFDYHRDLIALGREKHFSVFSGSDTRLPEVFALGADGCIGGMVNIVPDLMVHLYKVCHDRRPGNLEPAISILRQIDVVMDRLAFPLNVAAGMEARGLATGSPKAIVSVESRTIYREIVTELRELFAQREMTRTLVIK